MNDDTRFEELLGFLMDDEIAPEQLEELIALVREDPGRQAQLQDQLSTAEMIVQSEDYLRTSALFLATVQSRIGSDPFVDRVHGAIRSQDSSKRWWQSAAVAAAIGVMATAASLLVISSWFQPSGAVAIAEITGLNGALHFTGDGGRVLLDLVEGQQLTGGTLEALAADSWVEIEFLDGSTIVLSGQSSLTIAEDEQKELHLRRGDLSASVEPQPDGKPMLIHTPTADLEVLGTQFNVDAEMSSTNVIVNEGLVKVTRLSDRSVAEVPADHQLIAEVSRSARFQAAPKLRSVDSWNSDLPRGVEYGRLSSDAQSVHATSLLWRECDRNDREPVLLYVASLSVSRADQPVVELKSGCKFRIRGRMNSAKDLLVGLTTQHLKGGFAGKHLAYRPAKQFPKEGGDFDLVFAIEEFGPEKPSYPKSPIGLGLYDWWCLTINEDVGLSIQSVELLPDDRTVDPF